jgi:hypothetical protein
MFVPYITSVFRFRVFYRLPKEHPPKEHGRNRSKMSGSLPLKATKRTHPFSLLMVAANLASPLPSQDDDTEDIRTRKKPRLQEPLPASTDEATTKFVSHNATLTLPPVDVNVDADPMTDTHPNARGTRANYRWTLGEDAKLTSAVTNTAKEMWGKEYMTNWNAITALVPGRTKVQWQRRWGYMCAVLDNIDPTGKWTADEDKQLKDSVLTHGSNNWAAIVGLVPGRTKVQCRNRLRDALVSNIDPTTARAGKWAVDEDKKLKDVVPKHGGNNWKIITALVPGRTQRQCCDRWRDVLDPSIDQTTVLAGKWTTDEDKRLKDAVLTHGGKSWETIAALVPGRTKRQCCDRWRDILDPSIDRTTALVGKWTVGEDNKLKDSVLTLGNKNWAAIAALLPGRTKIKCCDRWRDALDPSIDPTTARVGQWTVDEDSRLQDSVLAHGDKDWGAVAALVPGRTKNSVVIDGVMPGIPASP